MAFIFVLFIVAQNPRYSDTQKEAGAGLNVKESLHTKEEYIPMCQAYPYDEVARNPTQYTGKSAVFTGKVIQVQESGSSVVLRVNVTKNQYGIYDDTVYIEYRRKSETEPRVLEDDVISVYGELCGIKTYETVLGSAVSIPYMKAEYIEAAK